MSTTDTVVVSTVTFAAGLTPGVLGWLKQRRRQPAENLRNEVAAAKDVNDMALATLQQVQREMEKIGERLAESEAAQQQTAARLVAVETSQEETVAKLARITRLFGEAVEALRDVLEAAKQGRVPTLDLSPELLTEIKRVGAGAG